MGPASAFNTLLLLLQLGGVVAVATLLGLARGCRDKACKRAYTERIIITVDCMMAVVLAWILIMFSLVFVWKTDPSDIFVIDVAWLPNALWPFELMLAGVWKLVDLVGAVFDRSASKS